MLTTSSNTRRPFGKPAEVAGQQAERVRVRRRRRDRDVQAQHVGQHLARVVLEARDDPGREAGEQDRDQVGPLGLSARRGSGTRPGRAPGAASPAPGARRTWRTPCPPPGAGAFQRSLSPIGTTTSLNSGLPRRETWTHGPDSARSSLAGSIIRVLRRLAAPQTPITDLPLIGSLGADPSRVRLLIGTWSAIVWTLSVAVASTPIAGEVAIRCRFCRGRRSPRSKIDAQVDEEAFVPLAREDRLAGAQRVGRSGCERG